MEKKQMKLRSFLPFLLAIFFVIQACNNDDDGPDGIPEADRTEQQLIDKEVLLEYLNTHYYNASAFEEPGDYSITDIVVTELPKDDNGNFLPLPDPENNNLLIDDVETNTVTLSDALYEYYILRINQGEGEKPDFTDNVRVNYSGMLEDGTVFDSTVNPIVFDLINVIPGWRNVLSTFNTADEEVTQNEDGTVAYNNYGFGMMFLPSGLSYFSQPPFGIPVYSNLVFKFELYRAEDNDHDGDSIPSHKEDLDNSLNVFDDDSDEDGRPNYLDPDDDGDGVLTRNEDLDNDGDPTNDLNADGVPLYLDPESRESKI